MHYWIWVLGLDSSWTVKDTETQRKCDLSKSSPLERADPGFNVVPSKSHILSYKSSFFPNEGSHGKYRVRFLMTQTLPTMRLLKKKKIYWADFCSASESTLSKSFPFSSQGDWHSKTQLAS